ncbi:Fur family transcriptional regulator [Rhizobacter sp. Root1221]|jgi:Fur family ferric uptake transcriptional regulator|uniref:Fur family transcriptional regulator n=1 Tax=Rhizobacter sp. Root1221 TaxID=1736433 RepID=UPI0006F6A814|nr:Fur family transcriptional regulator [Rhizobacter sp. Root1221]KQV99397.1 Fur family transcriptional regulator [Rhizobacter sp. Root1221]
MEHSFDLKHNGLKATAPRVKILELFRASDRRHLSAEDVYRLVLADDADLGLATVYRVLHQFEEAGLLKKSQLGNSKAVYELNDGERHHGHLVCTRTGDVKEFFDPVIEERLKAIATDLGFDLSDYVITAYGLSR